MSALVESAKVHYSSAMTDIESFIQDIPFLSFQQRRMLREQAQDLALWGLGGQDSSIQTLWPRDYDRTNKNQVRKIFSSVMDHINRIRAEAIDYATFDPQFNFKGNGSKIVTDFKSPERIMGKCPCPKDGEETRCCNLKTLDAVRNVCTLER